MIELTVTLKNDESTYRRKFLIYDPFLIDADSPTIKECIEVTQKEARFDPDDIDIKIAMSVK